MAASIGVVAVIETDQESCPWGVPVIGTAIGAVAFAVGALLSHHLGPVGHAAIGFGVACAAALLLSLSRLVRENFGTAGIWCLPALGACVGWLGGLGWGPPKDGWSAAVAFIFATSALARRRRKSPWNHVPFATSLALWFLVAVLYAGLRVKG
jgi:hypothetical protein